MNLQNINKQKKLNRTFNYFYKTDMRFGNENFLNLAKIDIKRLMTIGQNPAGFRYRIYHHHHAECSLFCDKSIKMSFNH